MARSRNIKPGFFRNDKLAECGPVAMLVFAGLWCISDYRGNLEYRPKRIKIDTIPYFTGIDAGIDYGIDSGIEQCIDRLIDTGFLIKYEVKGIEYLHIKGFQKHQKPHKNERDAGTSIPGIEKAQPETESIPSGDRLTRADSLVLIPDSFNTPVVPESIPGIEEARPETDSPPNQNQLDTELRRTNEPSEPDNPTFDEFWSVYPRKTNKVKAAQSWAKLKPSRETFDLIAENIHRRIAFGDWSLDRKDFIPHPSTFLNGRRWEDEIVPRTTGGQSHANQPSEKPRSAVDRVRAATAERERQRLVREGHGSALGAHDRNLRPPVDERLRGGSSAGLGDCIEGDYTREHQAGTGTHGR